MDNEADEISYRDIDINGLPPEFDEERAKLDKLAEKLAEGGHNTQHLCVEAMKEELLQVRNNISGPADHIGWRMRNCFEIIVRLLRFIETKAGLEDLMHAADREFDVSTARIIKNTNFDDEHMPDLMIEKYVTPEEQKVLNEAAGAILVDSASKKKHQYLVEIPEEMGIYTERFGLKKEYDSMYKLSCLYAHVSSMKLVSGDILFNKTHRVSLLLSCLHYSKQVRLIVGKYLKGLL